MKSITPFLQPGQMKRNFVLQHVEYERQLDHIYTILDYGFFAFL